MSAPIPEKCDENESCAQAPANQSRFTIRLPSLAEMAASVHRASADDSPAAEAERSSLDLARSTLPYSPGSCVTGSVRSAQALRLSPDELERTKPWEDRERTAQQRYTTYFTLASAKASEITDSFKTGAVTAGTPQCLTMKPAFWLRELEQLSKETPEMFCWRIDGGPQRALLGRNFFGAEAWWSLGINVGTVPPLPKGLTEELLNSDCPLQPKKKIKDTHVLVLYPQTVNGEACTALKLSELAASLQGSEKPFAFHDPLFYENGYWRKQAWATEQPTGSRWVLVPWLWNSASQGNSASQSQAATRQTQLLAEMTYSMASMAELLVTQWLALATDKDRAAPECYIRCENIMNVPSEKASEKIPIALLYVAKREFWFAWDYCEPTTFEYAIRRQLT